MNGYDYSMDDYSGSGYIPETSTGGIVPPQTGGGILDTLKGVFDRFNTRPTDTTSGVAGQLYQAIYAFGAGKLDAARESAARALLASKTGQQFVGTVERERIKQLAPMFILGAVILFGIAYALGRR